MTRTNEHFTSGEPDPIEFLADDRRFRVEEALRKWGDGTSGDPLTVAWRAIATAQVRHEFWAMMADGLDRTLTEDQFRECLRDRIRADFHEHLADAFMGAADAVMEGGLV